MPFVASPVLKTVQVVRSRNSGSRGAMHARRGIAARYIKANSSGKVSCPFSGGVCNDENCLLEFSDALAYKA
jgi:hypothetical protein